MTFFMSYSYLFSFCCLHLIHAIGNGHKKPWDCIIFLCRIYLIVSWSKHFAHFKIFIITFNFVLIRATNWEVMVARVRISALFAWICGPSRVITWPQKCQQKLNVWPKIQVRFISIKLVYFPAIFLDFQIWGTLLPYRFSVFCLISF